MITAKTIEGLLVLGDILNNISKPKDFENKINEMKKVLDETRDAQTIADKKMTDAATMLNKALEAQAVADDKTDRALIAVDEKQLVIDQAKGLLARVDKEKASVKSMRDDLDMDKLALENEKKSSRESVSKQIASINKRELILNDREADIIKREQRIQEIMRG